MLVVKTGLVRSRASPPRAGDGSCFLSERLRATTPRVHATEGARGRVVTFTRSQGACTKNESGVVLTAGACCVMAAA